MAKHTEQKWLSPNICALQLVQVIRFINTHLRAKKIQIPSDLINEKTSQYTLTKRNAIHEELLIR